MIIRLRHIPRAVFLLRFLIVVCCLACSNELYAQFDLHTNSWKSREEIPVTQSVYQEPQDTDTIIDALPCGSNTFDTVNNSGTIMYHQLSASSVTTTGTLLTRTGLRSLGVNANFGGGIPSFAFYGDTLCSNNNFKSR